MSELLYTIIATIGAIVFGSMQNILIPILIDSFNNDLGTPYYLLIMSALFFWAFFGLVLYLYKKKNVLKDYPIGAHKVFFWTGFFDAFTGILLVYSSDLKRTPIVLQSILSGTTVVFTIFTTKRLIESKKDINYKNWYVFVSLGLLATSVLLSTIPQYIISKWGPQNLFWIFVFLTGIICRAIYNTYQEKYIEMANNKEKERLINESSNLFEHELVVLYWTCFYQFFVMVFMLWVDLIPFFGYTKPSQFGKHFTNFFKCYFSIDCKYTLLLALGFVLGYIGSYFSAIYLNAKSATYSMLAATMIPPVVITFFGIFPSLNSGESYPIPLTVVCIVLNTASMVIWKYWEIKKTDVESINTDYQPMLNDYSP